MPPTFLMLICLCRPKDAGSAPQQKDADRLQRDSHCTMKEQQASTAGGHKGEPFHDAVHKESQTWLQALGQA